MNGREEYGVNLDRVKRAGKKIVKEKQRDRQVKRYVQIMTTEIDKEISGK